MFEIGIFVAVSVGSLAAIQAAAPFLRADRGRARRRIAEEFGAQPGSAPNRLYKDLAALDRELGADDGATGGGPVAAGRDPFGVRGRLADLLWQAGVPATVAQLGWAVAAAGFGLGAVGMAAGGWTGGAAGLAAGAAAPVVALTARARARRERTLRQLVGAFELMARMLRSGQSVLESFRAVAEGGEEPLAGEFAGCLHQLELGLRPEEAFRDLGKRGGVVELRLFVTAMTVHRQSGGNLSDILDKLAALVRARVRLRQRIRAVTAEGRLQSLTLLVLPPATFAAMYFLNRPYASILLAQTKLLLATAGLMLVGVVWVRRIMSFQG